MSLVRDNCLVPTYDAPELAYVKTSTSQQYVPDVFYKEKDKYGNEVTSIARPLPVEYLIVDVPAAMPKEPRYTFRTPNGKAKQLFPIENRLDQVQVWRIWWLIDWLIEWMNEWLMDQLIVRLIDFVLLSCFTDQPQTLKEFSNFSIGRRSAVAVRDPVSQVAVFGRNFRLSRSDFHGVFGDCHASGTNSCSFFAHLFVTIFF